MVAGEHDRAAACVGRHGEALVLLWGHLEPSVDGAGRAGLRDIRGVQVPEGVGAYGLLKSRGWRRPTYRELEDG